MTMTVITEGILDSTHSTLCCCPYTDQHCDLSACNSADDQVQQLCIQVPNTRTQQY